MNPGFSSPHRQMAQQGRRAIRTGRQAIRHLSRALWRRSILSGLLLAVANFLMLLGVSLLTLFTYSLWGSEASPLRFLLWPAVGAMVLSVVLRIVVNRYMRLVHRAAQIDRRRRKIHEKIRFSKLSVRKLPAP